MKWKSVGKKEEEDVTIFAIDEVIAKPMETPAPATTPARNEHKPLCHKAFQGGCMFLFRNPGRRRKRLCPGLLCVGLSARKMYKLQRRDISRLCSTDGYSHYAPAAFVYYSYSYT